MTDQARQSSFAWIDVLIVALVLAGVCVVLLPSINRERRLHNMAACGDNLQAIGKAMSAYANEYEDMLPVAGGKGTRWAASLANWSAADHHEAFGLDPNGTGGQATISSSLYLLIRHAYGDVTPRTFLCKNDKGVKEFDPADCDLRDKNLADLWDFGPNSTEHCSYAYQTVYGGYTLSQKSENWGFAIAADRNPWIDPPSGKAAEFSQFTPDFSPYGGTWEQAEQGNAVAHQRHGENVLFLDLHVEWERRPYCSLEDDNVYTAWNGDDKARGVPLKLGSVPADAKDSLLVNDPIAPAK
ncbi:MAG: hypothetical protein ABFD90_00385 [Phycisphaerales bacterium]